MSNSYFVFFKSAWDPTEAEEDRWIQETNDAQALLEKESNNQYYIGADDGMVFLGVPLDNKALLEDLFPTMDILIVDKEDYPLDYDFERDK